MKAKYLFRAYYRTLGFVMTLPGLILGYFCVYWDYKIPNFGFNLRAHSSIFQGRFENFTDELAITLVILGLSFIAFSKRKIEDELTAKLRLDALYWAVLVNYSVYFLVLIYKAVSFLLISEKLIANKDLIWSAADIDWQIYNLFTPLLIFVLRYYYLLYFKKDQFVIANLYYFPSKPFGLLGKILSPILLILALLSLFEVIKDFWETCFYVLPISLLLWAFSRNKNEDETMSQLRLESLQLATYVNYILLIVLTFTTYGLLYLIVLLFNLITILLCFVVIYEYKKYRFRTENERTNAVGGLLL